MQVVLCAVSGKYVEVIAPDPEQGDESTESSSGRSSSSNSSASVSQVSPSVTVTADELIPWHPPPQLNKNIKKGNMCKRKGLAGFTEWKMLGTMQSAPKVDKAKTSTFSSNTRDKWERDS